MKRRIVSLWEIRSALRTLLCPAIHRVLIEDMPVCWGGISLSLCDWLGTNTECVSFWLSGLHTIRARKKDGRPTHRQKREAGRQTDTHTHTHTLALTWGQACLGDEILLVCLTRHTHTQIQSLTLCVWRMCSHTIHVGNKYNNSVTTRHATGQCNSYVDA